MADFQQSPAAVAPAAHQPQAAEGGLALQAAIAQSEELQPGFQPGAPPPPLAGLSPEELAAQVDPCTGLSLGAVRVIDCYVEDVECLLAPWADLRGSDDPRFDLSALTVRTARFLETFSRVAGASVSGCPGAEGVLAERLQRGHIRRFVDEIRCLADPAQGAVALVPLARWLGLEGPPMPHHYTFQLIAGAEGGVGPADASVAFLRVTYTHPTLPGWTRLIQSLEVGASAGVGPDFVNGNISVGVDGVFGTSEATTHHYFSPAAFTSAHYSYQRSAAYVRGYGVEQGNLTIDAGGHTLNLDVGGAGVKFGAASYGQASVGVGVGQIRGVGPASVQPVAPLVAQPAAAPAPVLASIHELVFFRVGCAEVDAVGHATLEALIARVARIVDQAPGAAPQLTVVGAASADWRRAVDGEEARRRNEALAVDRTLAVQGALETRLASAGLPAQVGRQLVAAARVGDEEGAAFDRQVQITVSFDLCAPRAAALHAA
ncbi:MAG: hypothetical protein R3F60_26580 [bacterium]